MAVGSRIGGLRFPGGAVWSGFKSDEGAHLPGDRCDDEVSKDTGQERRACAKERKQRQRNSQDTKRCARSVDDVEESGCAPKPMFISINKRAEDWKRSTHANSREGQGEKCQNRLERQRCCSRN